MLPITAGARYGNVRGQVDKDKIEEIHLKRNAMEVLDFLL